METAKVDNAQFYTAEQLAEKYREAFTLSSVRWLLFNREANGLSAAVVQIGRKILIDEQAFVAWLREHRAAPAPRNNLHATPAEIVARDRLRKARGLPINHPRRPKRAASAREAQSDDPSESISESQS